MRNVAGLNGKGGTSGSGSMYPNRRILTDAAQELPWPAESKLPAMEFEESFFHATAPAYDQNP